MIISGFYILITLYVSILLKKVEQPDEKTQKNTQLRGTTEKQQRRQRIAREKETKAPAMETIAPETETKTRSEETIARTKEIIDR